MAYNEQTKTSWFFVLLGFLHVEQTINPSLILGSIQSFKKAGCKEFRCGPLFMLCCFSFSDDDCCQSPVIVCWLMGGGGIILCTCVPVWLCSFHLSVIRFRSWPITLREVLLQVWSHHDNCHPKGMCMRLFALCSQICCPPCKPAFPFLSTCRTQQARVY